jgi:hypothetical protein
MEGQIEDLYPRGPTSPLGNKVHPWANFPPGAKFTPRCEIKNNGFYTFSDVALTEQKPKFQNALEQHFAPEDNLEFENVDPPETAIKSAKPHQG